MLLEIQMPQWLTDFWTVYGSMITPVLVTLLVSLLTYIAIKLKSDAKINKVKADLQIQALKEVANREDNKPQLEEQSQKLAELEKVVTYLADMFDVAFQNSNLDPEIKANLSALINKIKYGSEEDLVKQLEETNTKLKEEVEALKEQITQTVTAEVETETRKRTRR